MENSAKAILMAGGILISILVVSIMVYLFAVFGSFSGDMTTKINGEKVTKFNNNFEKYEGRIDITAQEIVSIINFAKEYNDENQLKPGDSDQIKIYVHQMFGGKEFFKYCKDENKDVATAEKEFINESTNKYLIYRCKAKVEKFERYTPSASDQFTMGIKYNMTGSSDSEVRNQNGGSIHSGNDIIREIHFFLANCSDSTGQGFNPSNAQSSLYNLHTKEKCKWLNDDEVTNP